MSQNDLAFLQHMLDASQKALSFVEGYEKSDFESDEMLQLASIRLIEIIGEASRKVSPQTRDLKPEIPWAAIAGTRNRLVHGYFNVDLDIVWVILTNDLPLLEQNLTDLIATLSQSHESRN